MRQSRLSVRTHLLAFSAAILLPVLAFASILLWQYATSERARYEQEARSAAQRLSAALDLELSRMQIAAEALATFPTLRAGDFESFQQQALDALRVWSPEDPNKLAVVVRDRTSQQVANTRVPWGEPLPRGSNPNVDREIVETKRTVIQGIFVGATSRGPILSIRVPVLVGGEVTHILSMAMEPERFLGVLRSEKLPLDWVGVVVDREGRVIARSRDHELFVGQFAPDEFRAQATGDGGVWSGLNLSGEPVLGAYERSHVSGWRAYVGVPLDVANQPMRRSLWYIAALGVVALGLSFLLAVPFGDRIAEPLRALAEKAGQLGKGQPISSLSTHVREVDEVSDVLANAATELKEREAALRASEGRLRATHENAAVGVVEVDREGRFLYVNEARAKLTGHTREELLGRHFSLATDPGHLDQDLELFRRQVAGEFDIYTIEKQHRHVDGSTGWARVSSTAVRDARGEFLYAVRLIEDITERKRAEATQRLLIDELNHRVKNTLATVQALAYQTFRQSLPPEVARERFEARLLSLSRTHNLLNERNWAGAALKDVLALELEPFVGEHRARFVANGPEIELPARMAVVVGMIFHELATNAAKYGALSIPFGRVAVNWRIALEQGKRVLQVEWIERGGPPVQQPEHRGFGSRLIEQAAAQQLNGRAELRFATEGVTCRLDLPLDDSFRELQSAA
ncbi:MAG: hypothetical protein K0R61_3259 [Microvirga sp.]|jgi:PAS domain S-box-containing protein|nr:hypothetical protein [Microvirga sp.]